MCRISKNDSTCPSSALNRRPDYRATIRLPPAFNAPLCPATAFGGLDRPFSDPRMFLSCFNLPDPPDFASLFPRKNLLFHYSRKCQNPTTLKRGNLRWQFGPLHFHCFRLLKRSTCLSGSSFQGRIPNARPFSTYVDSTSRSPSGFRRKMNRFETVTVPGIIYPRSRFSEVTSNRLFVYFISYPPMEKESTFVQSMPAFVS